MVGTNNLLIDLDVFLFLNESVCLLKKDKLKSTGNENKSFKSVC